MRAIRALATAAGLCLAVTLPMPLPAAAEVPGQRASAYEAAVERWLSGDEAEALPELSRLAGQGNTAAQMLLALIDKTPALQGPWLARLPREERAGLMRAPGGLSGRSWMGPAADTEPSAALWLQMWRVDAPLTLPLDFAALGEDRAARAALVALDVRGVRGFAGIADDPLYPPAMRYLVWREWALDPERAADRTAETEALAPGDPQRAFLSEPPEPAALADWLMQAPESAPVATLCTDACPETARACALAAAEALGSHATLVTFGTPSKRLIPAEAFNPSPRGRTALLRRVLLNVDARGRRGQLARAQERDACFGALLEAEAQRYMPKRD